MSFGSAIATGFRKYADFTGSASRSEFWWFNLFLVLASIGVGAIWDSLQLAWFVAGLLPYLAVGVRRLRDAGFAWGLIFIGLVPFVGTVVMIVLWVQPTKQPAE
ncbi:MAG: DUF805 domain-containing protein [Microbacteriaceae bacterium]|jgi:uncharacterized membrane protein YhaH (DUF805 family)